MRFNKFWFKPRRFGYGATPTTWEGWTVVIVFIVYLLSISVLITNGDTNKYLLYLFAGIVAVAAISKKKTEGEWKWNWGKNNKEIKN